MMSSLRPPLTIPKMHPSRLSESNHTRVTALCTGVGNTESQRPQREFAWIRMLLRKLSGVGVRSQGWGESIQPQSAPLCSLWLRVSKKGHSSVHRSWKHRVTEAAERICLDQDAPAKTLGSRSKISRMERIYTASVRSSVLSVAPCFKKGSQLCAHELETQSHRGRRENLLGSGCSCENSWE